MWIKKLKLQVAIETNGNAYTIPVHKSVPRNVSLKELVPKFHPNQIDISLFMIIFERQAKRENNRQRVLCATANSDLNQGVYLLGNQGA